MIFVEVTPSILFSFVRGVYNGAGDRRLSLWRDKILVLLCIGFGVHHGLRSLVFLLSFASFLLGFVSHHVVGYGESLSYFPHVLCGGGRKVAEFLIKRAYSKPLLEAEMMSKSEEQQSCVLLVVNRVINSFKDSSFCCFTCNRLEDNHGVLACWKNLLKNFEARSLKEEMLPQGIFLNHSLAFSMRYSRNILHIWIEDKFSFIMVYLKWDRNTFGSVVPS